MLVSTKQRFHQHQTLANMPAFFKLNKQAEFYLNPSRLGTLVKICIETNHKSKKLTFQRRVSIMTAMPSSSLLPHHYIPKVLDIGFPYRNQVLKRSTIFNFTNRTECRTSNVTSAQLFTSANFERLHFWEKFCPGRHTKFFEDFILFYL